MVRIQACWSLASWYLPHLPPLESEGGGLPPTLHSPRDGGRYSKVQLSDGATEVPGGKEIAQSPIPHQWLAAQDPRSPASLGRDIAHFAHSCNGYFLTTYRVPGSVLAPRIRVSKKTTLIPISRGAEILGWGGVGEGETDTHQINQRELLFSPPFHSSHKYLLRTIFLEDRHSPDSLGVGV